MKTYRIGFGQFVVAFVTLVAVAGGIAWILKVSGVF